MLNGCAFSHEGADDIVIFANGGVGSKASTLELEGKG